MTATTVADEETPRLPTPAPRELGTAVREYVARVRGGDVGSLPAVLGLVVLVIVFSILRPETFTNAFNLVQPDPPGRRGHRHRDGPGLRAAARRDRPVRRLDGGRLRRRSWPSR